MKKQSIKLEDKQPPAIADVVQENYYAANRLHDKVLKLQAKVNDVEFDESSEKNGVYGMFNHANHTQSVLNEISNSLDVISLRVFGKKIDDL